MIQANVHNLRKIVNEILGAKQPSSLTENEVKLINASIDAETAILNIGEQEEEKTTR